MPHILLVSWFPLSALASHRMYIPPHSSRLATLSYLFTYTILLHYLLLPQLLITPPSYRGYSRTMVHPHVEDKTRTDQLPI